MFEIEKEHKHDFFYNKQLYSWKVHAGITTVHT